ncbi:MAG: hypothetical protein Kow0079_17670 [Vicingaceae bacterium]
MDKTKPYKIGIIGLGPVGSILAVKLSEAGCDVSICVRNEVKFQKIKQEGIVLENVINSKAKFVNIYKNISDLKDKNLDYIIVSVKTYHVPKLINRLAELNNENTKVIIAQNGIDVEELLIPEFGESKLIRMIINFAGNMTSPNTVKVTFFNPPNFVGSINDAIPNDAKAFADILNSVNLNTEAIDSFELVKRTWEKTILNASLSALCGVGKLTMAEAMNDPDTVELIEQIINEAVNVAENEKIKFSDDFIRKCMRYLKKGGDHFPSLALDIINNKPTEIDYFNGKIVEYGRKHYVRASLNLSFTNMVKAITNKNIIYKTPGAVADFSKKILDKGLVNKNLSSIAYKDKTCYLGIDLGSAYSKFCVIDEQKNIVFNYLFPTVNNDRNAIKTILQTIYSHFNIKGSCATGYGRKHFTDTDIIKTEINCAAAGVSAKFEGAKNIIDIGGEDIKIIHCDENNHVAKFYMNDKCAAGTGSFLAEIAERAEINISEMSSLAALSKYDKELNSFCTVFAKTEIMNWLFDGMSIEDISRGIYLSITNKIAKMKLVDGLPTYMIGGVIAHHPYLASLLKEKFNKEVVVLEKPQFMVSYGAAILAYKNDLINKKILTKNVVKN